MALNELNWPIWKLVFINTFGEEVHATYSTEAQAIKEMASRLLAGQPAWIKGPVEDDLPFPPR